MNVKLNTFKKGKKRWFVLSLGKKRKVSFLLIKERIL